jgi:hypothetical protein
VVEVQPVIRVERNDASGHTWSVVSEPVGNTSPEEEREGVLNRGVPAPRVQLGGLSQYDVAQVKCFILSVFNHYRVL